ncbi:MAG: sulfatase-like hydrolase/transferase [Lentisphaerae bacterium]|nr:sulfatase-like hydrolase/transferase [Lentisphaerota bacterium]
MNDKPVNIILILADSLRMDALGCYGNPLAVTPHMDALAAGGVRFETCYATSPLCVPSRAQILSGRHNHETGNLENPAWQYHTASPVEVDGVCLAADVATLPALLAERDYVTAHLGKNHFYPRHNRMGFQHMEQCDFYGRHVYELDDYYLFLKRHGYAHLFRDAFGRVDAPGGACGVRRAEFGLVDRLCPYVSKLPADFQATPWLGARARDFIRAAPSGAPFFLTVSFYAPHDPYCVSAPHDTLIDPAALALPPLPAAEQPGALYRGEQSLRVALPETIWRKNVAHYLANCALIDREVGGIVEALRAQGRYEESLIILTSDHGDTLGEHHIWGKGLLYEDCVRVPLIVHHGGGRIARGRSPEIATLSDLFPTILAQAGGAPPTDTRLAGRALNLANPPGAPDDRTVIGELGGPEQRQYFIRQGDWKLIHIDGPQAFELYDLGRDPRELDNQAAARPAMVQALRTPLDAWLAAEQPFWRHKRPDIRVDWERELRLSQL